MRNYFVFIFLLFFSLSSHTFLLAQNSDTTTLEDIENDTENASTENESEPILYKVDTSYYNKISEEQWHEIQNDKAFQYQKIQPKKEEPPSQPNFKFLELLANFFNSSLLKFILFALVGFVVLFVIYKIIINSEFDFFKKQPKKDNEIQSWENVKTYSDWELALQKALANKDYRLAMRIMYLEILQKLDIANLINYEQEKTNWDYVHQLGDTTYRQPFTQFTKYFDYVWYGNFTLNEQSFESIDTIYKQLKNDIRN